MFVLCKSRYIYTNHRTITEPVAKIYTILVLDMRRLRLLRD
jgi:hypothetical protein